MCAVHLLLRKTHIHTEREKERKGRRKKEKREIVEKERAGGRDVGKEGKIVEEERVVE